MKHNFTSQEWGAGRGKCSEERTERSKWGNVKIKHALSLRVIETPATFKTLSRHYNFYNCQYLKKLFY